MVSPKDVRRWLDDNAIKDDDKQVNVNSFEGGAWYVPDDKRDEFLHLYASVYNAQKLQFLNAAVPNDTWNVYPYMDVDFDRIEDFKILLARENIDHWAFYDRVAEAFGQAIGMVPSQIRSGITFCRKPGETNIHRFHLVCHNRQFIMTKSDMKEKVINAAKLLAERFNLSEITEKMKKKKTDGQFEDKDWCVGEHTNSEVKDRAAFVDLKALGIRPVGAGKTPSWKLKPKQAPDTWATTYQIYDLQTKERQFKVTPQQLQPHFLCAPGNDGRRVERSRTSHMTFNNANLTDVPTLETILQNDEQNDVEDDDSSPPSEMEENTARSSSSSIHGMDELLGERYTETSTRSEVAVPVADVPRSRKKANDHVREQELIQRSGPESRFDALMQSVSTSVREENAKIPHDKDVGRFAYNDLHDVMEKRPNFRGRFSGSSAGQYTLSALVARNRYLARPNRRNLMAELNVLHLQNFVLNADLRGTIYQLINERTTSFAASILFSCMEPKRVNGVRVQGSVAVESTKSGPSWYIYDYDRHRWGPPNPQWRYRNILAAILRAFQTVVDEFAGEEGLNWMEESDVLHNVRRGLNLAIEFVSGGATNRDSQVYSHLANLLCNADPLEEDDSKISEKMDNNPWLLGFPPSRDRKRKGGVLELRPPFKFRDGRPDDYISRQMLDPYIPWEEGCKDDDFKAKVKMWMKIYHDIFQDKPMFDFFMRAFASALGGTPPDLLIILTGHGNNGKSVATDLIAMMFGKLHTSISSASSVQKNGGSGAANPQEFRLKGARFRVDEEPEENESLNTSYIKQRYNDQTLRPLYGEPQTQKHFYRHFMCCNAIPDIRGADRAMTKRVLIAELTTNFIGPDDRRVRATDKVGDRNIKLKFPELTQSLASFLIRIWKANNGDIRLDGEFVPQKIRDKTAEVFKDMNLVVCFFDQKLVKAPHGRLGYTEIWNAWRSFCDDNKQTEAIKKLKPDVLKRMLKFDYGETKNKANNTILWKCAFKENGDQQNADDENEEDTIDSNMNADLADDASFELLDGLIGDEFSDDDEEFASTQNSVDENNGVLGIKEYDDNEAGDDDEAGGYESSEAGHYAGYTDDDEDLELPSEPTRKRNRFVDDDPIESDHDVRRTKKTRSIEDDNEGDITQEESDDDMYFS